ncbi:MAG: site-2 protease family protein [Clostridia bacterium]|nr:site-2 protease family protein [Clostridia bacterium]
MLSSLINAIIYRVPAVLIAICFHEFAHGFVSYTLGDPTPRRTGRLSLNPLNHLDPLGTLALLFVGFGWAKPVMVNPEYYENKKMGMVKVALAGPVMNFLIAFICLLIYHIQENLNTDFGTYINNLLPIIIIINIGLSLFNLIPIPPLDGSKVLGAILPEDKYFAYMKWEAYGQIIVFALLFMGLLDVPLTTALGKTLSGMETLVIKILDIF